MRRYFIAARVGVGLMLIIFWGLFRSPLLGVIFILALTALSAIRYRFSPHTALITAEIALCLVYAYFWVYALLGLWLPVIGLLESAWGSLEKNLLEQGYEDRAERYRLESARDVSRKDMLNAARLAEMAERSRIAQDIHDHVGHEITGASLALQAAIKLYDKGDARAGELLEQTARRLDFAAEHLRETVHNLKPARMPGSWMLKELCEKFEYCEIRFTEAGDLSGAVYWGLLEANLKEALTNIARHSNASEVAVRLDGNAVYIRLAVADNGSAKAEQATGLGLSGMNDRIRTAGGSMAVNTTSGFEVVFMLPKGKD